MNVNQCMLIDHACLCSKPFVLHCRKFGDPRLVLDVAYNLVYSWHFYSSDADCYLFLHMLMGKLATNPRILHACSSPTVVAHLCLEEP